MPIKRYTPEQIISKLREAEAMLAGACLNLHANLAEEIGVSSSLSAFPV